MIHCILYSQKMLPFEDAVILLNEGSQGVVSVSDTRWVFGYTTYGFISPETKTFNSVLYRDGLILIRLLGALYLIFLV